MPAAVYTIHIDQGATYDRTFTIRNRDLTGYTARLQARVRVGRMGTVLNMSTENGKILIDGPAGKIRFLLTAAQTEALASGIYVYDFVTIAPNSTVKRWLKGTIQVDAGVTRL